MPAVTVEWTAQPGDVRRATLSLLRQPRFWQRVAVIAMLIGAVLTGIYLLMGITWQDLVILVPGLMVFYVLLAIVLCMFGAYRQNAKVLRAGARWAAGSDATRVRIDNPVNTIILDRANIESIEHNGALVVLTVRPQQRMGIPVALHGALVTEPLPGDLID